MREGQQAALPPRPHLASAASLEEGRLYEQYRGYRDGGRAFPAQYWQIVLTTGGTGVILLLFTKPIKKLTGGAD